MAGFILLFWFAQFGLLTAEQWMYMPGETLWRLVPRGCVTIVAIGVSFGIADILGRLRARPLAARLGFAMLLALAGATIHLLVNTLTFRLFVPQANWASSGLLNYLEPLFQWFWSYAAMSGMVIALHSGFEVQERERQISQLQRVAHEAQLRALRYQLNPHFMFNTLNSIAALISRKKTREGEAMVENLADFLRASLSIDPLEDIPLSREIELQSLYLAIETVRFVDRLKVTFDVSDEAAVARVPSLVTQPLVENVIRHAVVDTAAPIELAITAAREDDELVLSVVNTVPDHAPRTRPGTGVGLANVEARLRARFDKVRFRAGVREDGRYEVCFAIPYHRERAA